MSIHHHPDDLFLTAFAAGTLDLGQHVAVATHLVGCARCRAWVRAMENVGGAVLNELPPAPMSADALKLVEQRLEQQPTETIAAPEARTDLALPRLPKFVRGYQSSHWKWVAPRVSVRPITLPSPSETRVFLLKSGPGTRMLQHSHTGIELTCVLAGAFSHEGGRFGPGDFDLGDDNVDHRPIVEAGEDCICLVAMQGKLRLKGVLGRLMQPLVRL